MAERQWAGICSWCRLMRLMSGCPLCCSTSLMSWCNIWVSQRTHEVTSQVSGFPASQGTRPSGHFPSDWLSPFGSLVTGIPAKTMARATNSFSAWCLAVLSGVFLQTKARRPCASTKDPQWLMWHTKRQTKPQTYASSHCFIVKSQATWWYGHRLKPVSTMWCWDSQKRGLLS